MTASPKFWILAARAYKCPVPMAAPRITDTTLSTFPGGLDSTNHFRICLESYAPGRSTYDWNEQSRHAWRAKCQRDICHELL